MRQHQLLVLIQGFALVFILIPPLDIRKEMILEWLQLKEKLYIFGIEGDAFSHIGAICLHSMVQVQDGQER